MNVLVTGGLGYIGSHTVVALIENNHNVVVLDNLSNSSLDVLHKLKVILRKEIKFFEVDVLNTEILVDIIKVERIDAVIHFAAFKSVSESINQPYQYHVNNVMGTHSVLKAMEQTNVTKFVYSSSATVYENNKPPFNESMKIYSSNPYGESKIKSERLLHMYQNSINSVALRYFNPVGSHKSGIIGDNPVVPNNIMPIINRVATKQLYEFNVYGDDYSTADGTAIRDYVHVMDVARAHVLALEYLESNNGYDVFNIGTGQGYSVLDLLHHYKLYNHVPLRIKILGRRQGDVAVSYANVDKAKEKLGFETVYDLKDMVIDSYNFAKKIGRW
jgi:UDP-glucose 4-epimerase